MGQNITPRLLIVGAIAALSLCGAHSAAADGHRDARVRGTCTASSRSQLRVRAEDGRLRIDVRLDVRAAGRWRVVLLHERRIVSSTTLRASGDDRALELRRSVADWFGTDTIAVRATGPRGETCRAAVTI